MGRVLLNQKVATLLENILLDESSSFTEIVERLGLDPARSFQYADLRGVDFGGADLSKYDMTGAILGSDSKVEVKQSQVFCSDKNPSAAKKQRRFGFETNQYVVYPTHGVGRIVAIEEWEFAGCKIESFFINFEKDKMTLPCPPQNGKALACESSRTTPLLLAP